MSVDVVSAPASSSWRGPRALAVLIGVVTMGLIVVLATRQPATERAAESRLIGGVAPEIAGVEVLSGKRAQLSSSQGRWTLVNFFAPWCTGCIAEHGDLVSFSENNPDVQMIAVVSNENEDDVREFYAKRGGNWPVIDDSQAPVVYGVTALPETFLITPDGRIAQWFKGASSERRIQASLDEGKRVLEAGVAE
jgi:thiol-disulfide isomerase/thioredoxin